MESIKVDTELKENAADYKPFSEGFMRAHPSPALKAVMDVVMCHVADMFTIIVDVVSRKYGHSVEDLIGSIRDDEAWKNASVHPLLKSLSYFSEDDVAEMTAGKDLSGGIWAGVPPPVTPPPAKRRKVAAKVAAAAAVAAPAPAPAPANKDEEEAKALAKQLLGISIGSATATAPAHEGSATSLGSPLTPAPKKKLTLKAAMKPPTAV